MKHLLIIGRHAHVMQHVTSLLLAHGYVVDGALTNDDALRKFTEKRFEVVVMGGGLDAQSRELLQATFRAQNPNVKIVDGHPQTILRDLKNALAA